MTINFEQFTSNAFNCTSEAEYKALVASESEIRSDLIESSSTYVKYSFIPKNNDDQLYDSISICFCTECSEIVNDFEPCENCFPQDEDDDQD
jgi:hypothetical protein